MNLYMPNQNLLQLIISTYGKSTIFFNRCTLVQKILPFVLYRILNLGMNKLNRLPRGFGNFPMLEILDLSYNHLSENELLGNFWMMQTLRALYLR